jgi:hypothetical protein
MEDSVCSDIDTPSGSAINNIFLKKKQQTFVYLSQKYSNV